MKALIVEDSTSYQLLVEKVLRKVGVESLCVKTSHEALDRLAKETFDLIILDLYIEDMTGLELCSRLKENEVTRLVPIVLLTSEKNDLILSKGYDVGVTEILKKDDFEKVSASLQGVIEGMRRAHRGHVLYVEDSPTTAQLTMHFLESMQLEVDHYENAEAALKALDKRDYDLVITDILLSGAMNGVSLTRAIRSLDGQKHQIPIIAISGYEDTARRIEALRQGANDYLSKPVEKTELVARVGNLLTTKYLIDQLRASEMEVRKSEERIRSILENAVDGIITIDDKGSIQSFSPPAERMFGYSTNEVIGKNIKMLMPAKTASQHDGYLEQYAKTGNASIIGIGREDIARRKDGSEFPIDLSIGEATIDGSSLFTGIIRDITERKRAIDQLRASEMEVRKSEERMRSILENAVDGIITIDDKGVIQSFSPPAERMFGYSTNEVIGKNIKMLMPAKTASQHDGYLEQYAKTGNASIIGVGREDIARRKDGSEFPIDLSIGEAVIDGSSLFTGIIRDITERKQAEVMLRGQKLQLDAAVDNMTQGLIMFDTDERVVLMNQRYLDLYGLSPDIVKAGCSQRELLEHRQELGLVGGDIEKRRHEHLDRIAEGESWSFVNDLADDRSIRVAIRPLTDGGWVSTHEDITERQRLYRELEHRSTYDGLTGALNRAEFDKRLAVECQSADRHTRPLALLMIDIDFFKRINDNHGHQIGDRVLQAIVPLMDETARGGDVVARYGGEEFAVILPDAEDDSAMAIAERTRANIERKLYRFLDNDDLNITASIGCASRLPSSGGADDLVKAADAALYQAKSSGRNRVVSAKEVLQAQ